MIARRRLRSRVKRTYVPKAEIRVASSRMRYFCFNATRALCLFNFNNNIFFQRRVVAAFFYSDAQITLCTYIYSMLDRN